MVIIDSYSESSYLADQVLADIPPISNGNCRFLLWELIFVWPNVGRSTSHQMAISQIAALTAHISFLLWELIFVWPSVGRSSPQMAISQIAALTAHISFLLWELIFGRPGVGRSNPPLNSNFTDSYSDSSYFIPTLRAHICLTKCWQIYPHQMAI